LDRFYQVIAKAEAQGVKADERTLAVDNPVLGALKDDLNTPKAVAELHQMAGQINKQLSPAAFAQFYQGGKLLGIFGVSAKEWFQGGGAESLGGLASEDIEALILERSAAKVAKDFARADGIRKGLLGQGIVLEDQKDGPTTWKRV
jgi:cysteinyl-tRNA synthetase